jgi:DNA anti-recombination protein RmuC
MQRLETLKRLITLYAAIEDMHSTELQRITAAVREAQRAIGTEREIAKSARVNGRVALLGGDRVCWMMAETRQETAARRGQRLEQVRVEREELNDAAREQYVASRLKREQVKRVFDEIATRVETEQGRRMQAASDDGFLTRRRWTDAREMKRGDL